MERVDYTDTFIAVAPDSTATAGVVPSTRRSVPTVASATYEMIAAAPYAHRSSDVIFAVWADRNGISDDRRSQARAEFYARPQACLRSSDLGKRLGWGIHANEDGRVALYAVGSPEYEALAAGRSLDGRSVAVTAAMRSSRDG